MKASKAAVSLLLVFLVVMVPIPVLATNNVVINGQMDSNENWTHWFTDQTYQYQGYPNHQQAGNTLGFDAYYASDNSNLYLFIQTDDNTVSSQQRDKFMVYFDVFPYGRGPEDIAYSIEVPTNLYAGGVTLQGPDWSNIQPYNSIAASSSGGHRTFEVAVPLNQIVPDKNNVNYRNAKLMIYLENYGDFLWAEHKVVNYYPDAAGGSNYWKNTCGWQQIDLATLCHDFFNPAPKQYSLTVNTVGGGSVVSNPNQTSYVNGTIVQLTANPNAGYQFSGWSGNLTGTSNPASITLTSNKSVTATFTQIPYNLTINVIGSGTVTKNPSQSTYTYGTSVQLTAAASAGWSFSSWTGSITGTANPIVLAINESKFVIASFTQNNQSLILTTAGSGSGHVFVNGTGPYHNGDVVQLSAIANVGSSFSGWSGDLSGSSNPVFLTINGNKSVCASFAKNNYALTINPIGSGSVTRNPSQSTYFYGTTVQLTAVPASGWSFAGWSGDLSGNTNPASINMTANKAVAPIFTQDQYAVTLNINGQGNPTRTPNQAAYIYGEEIQLNANPASGWTFAGWTSNTSQIIISNPTQTSTSATINGAGTITAIYTQNNYSLTINVTPLTGGSVTVDKPAPYHYGDVVTLTEYPSAGYTFSGWSGDARGSGITYAITVDGNKAVTANFVQNDYAITVAVNPSAGGFVTADRSAPYHYGDIVTLTAQPNPGYSFSAWSGDASGTSSNIQFTVTSDLSLAASFTQNEYQLTVNVIGNGSVTKSIEASYHYGDIIALNATSAPGWTFANWTGDFSGTTNPATITINGDMVVNAVFTQNQYTIQTDNWLFGTMGSIIVSPEQSTYTYGELITINPVPASGFKLSLISVYTVENGKYHWVMDSSNPIIDLPVNGNLSIYAFFENTPLQPSGYNLVINAGTGGRVSGSPNGTYNWFDIIQLRAIPDEGYVFAGWSGDIVAAENPLTVYMFKDLHLTASFVSAQGLPPMYLSPERIVGPKPDVGDTFDVTLRVDNISKLWMWATDLKWNPEVLQLVGVSEGAFLKSAGETLFLTPPLEYQIPGYLDQTVGAIFGPSSPILSSVDGNGTLATFTFKVLSYGNSDIQLINSQLCEVPDLNLGYSNPIPHQTMDASFNLTPPPASGPTAKFDLPNGGMCQVGDLLTLDASNSLPGYDTLPAGHPTTNAITQYNWNIDFNNDGTVDIILQGEKVSVVIPYVGTTSITLTVTAPDSYSPTSPDYNQTDTTTKLIQVESMSTKANIDVYTQRGGVFANQSSDAYGPQELIIIHALVTYNDAPVVGKDVSFEIRSGDGSLFYVKIQRTDDDGLASIEVRVPWLDDNPESLMGNWTILATVDISEQVVADVCSFQFGYLINIESTQTFTTDQMPTNSFARQNSLSANITLRNIESIAISTVVAFTVYDEASVPVAVGFSQVSAAPQADTTITVTAAIPSWAFVGLGKLYVNAYTALPSNGGVVYCPEKSASINIIS